MRFENVCLESVGYALPEEVVTSSAIEAELAPVYERLRLPPGRLELMTGVRERRFFPRGTRVSAHAAAAGERALVAAEANGFDRARVGMLSHCSVCRDFLEPATATVVHRHLKLSRACGVFDLGNACLGVLNGIVLAGTLIESRQIDAALLVSGEDGRDLVESTIRAMIADESMTRQSSKLWFASLTIGSAAVAMLLTHRSISKTGRSILGGVVRADTDHNDLCQGDASAHGTLMQTDSEELLKHGVALAADTWRYMRDEMNWTDPNAQIDRIICHQVGRQHQKAMLERLGLDPTKDYTTFDRLGNVGSAALPITLALAAEAGHVQPGHTVAMLGIGSGINCLMLGLTW